MYMGTEDGDRLVLGLTTTIDGSTPHRVFVVFHMPIGMAMVTQNAFAIQVAVLVNVARSLSDNGGGLEVKHTGAQRVIVEKNPNTTFPVFASQPP
eukprot:COSAG06_NODE_32204_length_509_cov_8.968293_2_plen_95_part_00